MRKTILQAHQICFLEKGARKNTKYWAYSPCKGYRLCKMVSLAHKLKMLKLWKKRFYKQIGVVLCKKPLE